MISPGKSAVAPLLRPSVQRRLLAVAVSIFLGQFLLAKIETNRSSDIVNANKKPAERMLVDINRADVRELSLLPAVGPILAQRIVANRTANGKFRSVGDLARVHGLGEKKLAQLADYCEIRSRTADPLDSLAASETP